MTTKPYIYELKLKQGSPIYNAVVEVDAPQVPGFIAICTDAAKKEDDGSRKLLPATRYINIDNIAELTITNGMLCDWSINCFIPERAQKVKIDK